MQIWIAVLGLFLLAPTSTFSQEFVNSDKVYIESVKSVWFGIPAYPTAFPIVELGQGLQLTFDEIGNEMRYLRYKIEHCDRDWQPSDLTEMEFLTGFNDEELRQSQLSVSTRIPYVHYKLSLPNKEVQWTKSGNYLLHVYDEDTETPLLTRRFMVFEPIMDVGAALRKPTNVDKNDSHHEIDFIAKHEELIIKNPRVEIKATVLQNGRWDNAITEIEPFQVLPNKLSFDYQDRITFAAGKQFRTIDLRTFRHPTIEVNEIKEYDDAFEIILKQDEKRTYENYDNHQDLNGQFIIESQDFNNGHVQGEYGYVIFSLKSALPLYDDHVYLMGGFTSWQIDPKFIMNYEERYGMYIGEALLKQGIYDYVYAAVPKKGGPVDMEILEGNWHQTENHYTILIYYKPFGARYDRIIGAKTVSATDLSSIIRLN